MNSEFYRNGTTPLTSLLPSVQAEYRISLTLGIADVSALWAAASARLLAAPGMTPDDVIDVIGPCEDPSIIDCIATVAKPETLPGCSLDDFWIDGLKSRLPRSEGLVAVVPPARAPSAEQLARRSSVPRRSITQNISGLGV